MVLLCGIFCLLFVCVLLGFLFLWGGGGGGGVNILIFVLRTLLLLAKCQSTSSK